MLKNSVHLFRIFKVLSQHGLLELLDKIDFLKKYMWLLRAIPTGKIVSKEIPRGDRLCMALEQLGPVFVKFGQMLSTRPDLLPSDIASSLVKLQDKVAPFAGKVAVLEIEKALGQPISDLFKQFELESTASASVAQVHYAQLHDGTDVVVKVLRPGIDKIINRDLSLIHSIADILQKYWGLADRIKPKEIVEDYDRTIHDELDLKREAANASQLKINFKNSDLIYVPEVYWDYIRSNVMVMERIYGISIRDIEAIKAANIDLKKLAHDGVEIFFTQAFRDGFFHADMHPGNIFVAQDGQYRAVDFGIMGTLDASDRRYLAENLLAFFDRDYLAVADAHIRSGWVPPDTNAQEFESAVRTVCEPIFAKPISEISFGTFLIDLFKVARRFKMPVQPQLVLLQKTLLNIEGLGRQLYPDLDLWETAQPFLKKWMSEQIGPRAALKTLRREMPNFFTLAPEIPALSHQLLYRLKNDQLDFHTRDQEIKELRQQLLKQSKRSRLLMLGGFTSMVALFAHYLQIDLTQLPIEITLIVLVGVIIMLWTILKK